MLLALTVQAHAEAPAEQVPPEVDMTLALSHTGLDRRWHQALAEIELGNVSEAGELLRSLETLRDELGLRSLEPYSLQLLAIAEQRLRLREKQQAAFYLKRAMALSPRSALVLYKSLPLLHQSGVGGMFSTFSRATLNLLNDPATVFSLLLASVYPVLWSLTLALYITLAALLFGHIGSLVRQVGLLLPLSGRGVLAPLIVVVSLCLPVSAGPVWSVIVWSLYVFLFVPVGRWLILSSGIVIGMWASLIPIRENIAIHLEQVGARTLVNNSSGSYGLGDLERMAALRRVQPADPALAYTHGRLLLRAGQYDAAGKAFQIAEANWHAAGNFGQSDRLVAQTKAERGLVAFLQGDMPAAEQLFSEAEALGLNTSAFYANFSKVKFEAMDTAGSREYWARAQRMDPGLTESIKIREDKHGIRNPLALAEFSLPMGAILSYFLDPISGASERFEEISARLMIYGSPLVLGCSAFTLILLFLLPRRARSRSGWHRHFPAPAWMARFLKLVPGGAWIVSNRPASCFALLALILLATIPVVPWPGESGVLLGLLPSVVPFYVAGLLLFASAVVYVGFVFSDAED